MDMMAFLLSRNRVLTETYVQSAEQAAQAGTDTFAASSASCMPVIYVHVSVSVPASMYFRLCLWICLYIHVAFRLPNIVVVHRIDTMADYPCA